MGKTERNQGLMESSKMVTEAGIQSAAAILKYLSDFLGD